MKKYITSIEGQSGAGTSAQHVRDTTIGSLKAKTFTLKKDDGTGTIQLINFTLLYTQATTYTFEYVYSQDRKEVVKDEYKTFISSIRTSPDLQRNDQYLSNAKGLSPALKVAIYGGGALIVIFIIVTVVRRKRRLSLS